MLNPSSTMEEGSGAASKVSIVILIVDVLLGGPEVEKPRPTTWLLNAPVCATKEKLTLVKTFWVKLEKFALYRREFPPVSKSSIPNAVLAVPVNVATRVTKDVDPLMLTDKGKSPNALDPPSVPTS
jgi:hypothetical protein